MSVTVVAVPALLALLTLVATGIGPPARSPLPAGGRRGSDGLLRGPTALVERLGRARRRRRRDAQLPDLLDRLAAALRAGQAPGPALESVAAEAPDPLGTELRAVTRRLRSGVAVAPALQTWADDPESSDEVRLTAATLILGAGAGGAVARAVDGVAATLRERSELAAEVRALATQARSSAAVLAAAPVAFTTLVATVEPAVVGFLLTTSPGLACLVLGTGLQAAGATWMARIVREAG